jgi:hypothetical protein
MPSTACRVAAASQQLPNPPAEEGPQTAEVRGHPHLGRIQDQRSPAVGVTDRRAHVGADAGKQFAQSRPDNTGS